MQPLDTDRLTHCTYRLPHCTDCFAPLHLPFAPLHVAELVEEEAAEAERRWAVAVLARCHCHPLQPTGARKKSAKAEIGKTIHTVRAQTIIITIKQKSIGNIEF